MAANPRLRGVKAWARPPRHRPARRSRLLVVLVVACLLVSLLAGASAGAQGSSGGGVSRQAIAVRDGLIADQEALLNVYRCRFGVDTEVVGGGCVDGRSLLGPVAAGVFEGVPTLRELGVRDRLVAQQEALLNVYRCRFGIDVQVVPGGCAGGFGPNCR